MGTPDDPRGITPYQKPQQQKEDKTDIAMLAEHLEVDAVRGMDVGRVWRITGKNVAVIDLEAAPHQRPVLRKVERHHPRVDPSHRGVVLLVILDRPHPVFPFLRHESDHDRHQQYEHEPGHQLVAGLEPQKRQHGGHGEERAARLRAERR